MRGLTYSNAMASAAVFIALGGSSYAAVKVTGEDVKNGSLSGKDVRTGSLGSGDIRNGSLRAADLRPDVLKAGPVGPKGDKGDPGDGGRWLLIDENGDVAEQSGGFRVISRPGSNGQPATNPNVYVDAGGSLVGINCVPAGTNEDDTLVVRSLADNTDVTSQTRRVWIHVTG